MPYEERAENNQITNRSNEQLVCVIHQLACVVFVAERVFSGVCDECTAIRKRTDTLRRKIQKCSEIIKKLNAKTVPIPVGNLNTSKQRKESFTTHYKHEWNFLTSDTRPQGIKKLYEEANSSPLPTLQSFSQNHSEEYADTGREASSNLKRKDGNLEVVLQRPYSCYMQEFKNKTKCTNNQFDYSSNDENCSTNSKQQDWLPSQEQMRRVSSGYPSSLVPIDITGSNFQKMSTFRRSLIHLDFFIKRKKKNKRNIVVINKGTNKTQNNRMEAVRPSSSNEKNNLLKQTEQSNYKQLIDNSKSTKADSEMCKESKSSMKENIIPSINNKSEEKETIKHPNLHTNKPERATGLKKGCGFLPISTFSAAMTVAVKLRETSTENKMIDGHPITRNCTGNTLSRRLNLPYTNSSSKSSLGRDSISSEARDTDRSQDGTLTGYTSDDSTTTSGKQIGIFKGNDDFNSSNDILNASFTSSIQDSEKNYKKKTVSKPDDVIKDLRTKWSNDGKKYLSPESISSDSFGSVKSYNSCSSESTVGNNSLNSLLSQTTTEFSNDSSSLFVVSKFPPTPPLRISSMQNKSDPSHMDVFYDILNKPDSSNDTFLDYATYVKCKEYVRIHNDKQKVIEENGQCLSSSICNKKAEDKVLQSFSPEEQPPSVPIASTTNMNETKENETPNNMAWKSCIVSHKMPIDDKSTTVPLKYMHHITITPIARQRQNSSSTSILTPQHEFSSGDKTNFKLPYFSKQKTYEASNSSEKVIFSSNSLGRRRDNHPMNYMPFLCTPEHKYATLPLRQSSALIPRYGAYVKLNPDGKVTYSNTVPQHRNRYRPQYPQLQQNPNTEPENHVQVDLSLFEGNLTTVLTEASSENHNTNEDKQHRTETNSSECHAETRLSDIKQTDESCQSAHAPNTCNSTKTPLSTDNLFAVIHRSKRRHNIKLDESPLTHSCSAHTSFTYRKASNVETRFLSPPNVKDKRNHYSLPKSSVNKIYPTSKTTSIHEFKMLLLQTSGNSQSPHKTAVEQLKTKAWCRKPDEYNSTISALDCANTVSQCYVPYESATIPLKRNSQTRASLPNRQVYPPIWEDNFEESETINNKKYLNCLKSKLCKEKKTTSKPAWVPPHSASAWV